MSTFEGIIFFAFFFYWKGLSSFLKRLWRRAIVLFAYAIRYEFNSTRSSRTTTANCAQGQGSSLTLPLFDPS